MQRNAVDILADARADGLRQLAEHELDAVRIELRARGLPADLVRELTKWLPSVETKTTYLHQR